MISPTILREHVTTDLPDSALQRIIDDNEALVQRLAGPHPPVTLTETYDVWPLTHRLVLERPIATLISVIDDGTLLDNSTIRVLGRQLIFERPVKGLLEVTYTPIDDTAARTQLLIELCLLDIQDTHTAETQTGDVRVRRLDVLAEKLRAIRQRLPYAAARIV
jgi:hypothetical protein